MLPYFQIISFNIGPITIFTWGLLLSLGFLAGMFLAYKKAKQDKFKQDVLLDLFICIIAAGLVFGRLAHVFFYNPDYYLSSNWVNIFKVWHGGFSSFGGLPGGLGAVAAYSYYKRINFLQVIDYIAFGVPAGLVLGRLGCTLIHDHPGPVSNSWLAFDFPGGPRLDLGFLDLLNGLIILIAFLFLGRKQWFKGFFAALFCAYYGLSRFFMDFLRPSEGLGFEPKYLGLTFAQYAGLAFFIFGLLFFLKYRKYEK